ncbi:hypothetical protein C9374_003488 [Naegleria lovaniensis]|uniref:Uncharacterized protein n=1 Tax=Naegleria lovaniensis TaxID=51637 RepID=A0AA88KKE1_NAELO|nr:uncharacterized protein C9374_003488 [Naegleria lovaniensis]KAG2385673.1 hypothetical protein C9374_003488 [Naegleria lovaniensis]
MTTLILLNLWLPEHHHDEFTSSDTNPSNHLNELYEKLQLKIRRKKWPCFNPERKSLTMNSFTLVHTFGEEENTSSNSNDNTDLMSNSRQMTAVYDVKISYRHGLIFIVDYNQIQVFDLYSKQFKHFIRCQGVTYLYVQEDETYSSLIVVRHLDLHSNEVVKYDLEMLLFQSSSNSSTIENEQTTDHVIDPLWKHDLRSTSTNVSIWKSRKLCFVAETVPFSAISVLDLNDGRLIETIPTKLPNLSCLAFMDFNETHVNIGSTNNHHSNYLFVGSYVDEDAIEIYSRTTTEPNGSMLEPWTLITTWQGIDYQISSLLFDWKSGNLIVAELAKPTIHFLNLDGEHVKEVTFANDKNKSYGCGEMCVNEITGEFFICDYDNNLVFDFL